MAASGHEAERLLAALTRLDENVKVMGASMGKAAAAHEKTVQLAALFGNMCACRGWADRAVNAVCAGSHRCRACANG
jgi:hypothetical protein